MRSRMLQRMEILIHLVQAAILPAMLADKLLVEPAPYFPRPLRFPDCVKGLLIDIAGIPRSTYYYYSKQYDSPKPDKYKEIKELIRKIYDENKGRYGYRRITKEVRKTHKINHNDFFIEIQTMRGGGFCGKKYI